MNCSEMIEELKKFPKDKPIKIMGWYSIAETDDPEDINSVCYLKEVDIDNLFFLTLTSSISYSKLTF